MVAVATIVADDAHEAQRLSMPNSLLALRMLQGGRPGRIPTLAQAEAHPWTEAERAWMIDRNAQQAIGNREAVTARIDELVADTGANEVLVVPQGPDLESRLRTLRHLAGA